MNADQPQEQPGESVARWRETGWPLLKAVADTMPSLVVVCDPAGRIVLFNRACEELTGHKREAVIGKTMTELLVPPEWVLVVQKLCADPLAPELRAPHEIPWLTKTGEQRMIEWRCAVVLDPESERPCIFGTGIDITERKRAEDNLREGERKHRLVLDHVDEIVYMVKATAEDPSGGEVQFVSARAEQLLGYAPEEFLVNPSLWFTLLHPDDIPVVMESTQRIFASRETGVRIYRLRHKRTGAYHWMEDRVVPQLREDGQVMGIFGVARDITERMRIEEALCEGEARFRAIFEQAAVGVAQVALDGRWLDVNRRLCEIVGYEESEMLARTFQDITHPDDLEADLEFVRRMLAGEISTYSMEKRYIRKDGLIIWINLTVALVHEPSGAPRYFVSVIEDITARRHADEKVKALTRRLMEVQEDERRHLARELHDQVGQALTAVQINLQACQKLSSKPEAAQRLAGSVKILEQVQSQIQSLSLWLRPSMLDDLGLVSALRGYVREQAERAGLAAKFSAPASEMHLDPVLETACFRIAQEALTNVLRHAKARKIAVKLRSKGGLLDLTIEDDGIGFDPKGLRQPELRGRCIGLLGMEERASIAGGRLEILSQPGQGTKVRASFPLTPRPPGTLVRE